MTLSRNTQHAILAALALGAAVFLFPQITLASGWSYVEAFFYTIVVSVFGSIAGWGGTLLDYAINYMVIGFGDMYIDKGLGFTIDSLWVTVRDIFNLTFIFGLVFIGLRLIFDSANTSARKTLVSLIMAALLVNFSLFITKFVIDFSNIAAVQLVTSAFPPDAKGKSQISGSFVQLMGGQTVFSIDSITETKTKFENGFEGGAGFTLIMGTLIVFLVLTFVFMGGALLLMIRFVALMFYMLLSPLMFAGMVFPSAGRITQEFWSGFLGKAFFAPAYILMLYFSYKILSTFQVTGGGSLAKGFVGADKQTVETVLPPFVLGSIFLIASLIIAQKMGATGAGGVISAGKMLTGKVKGYARRAGMAGVNAATYTVRAPARAGTNWVGGKALKSFNNWQANAKAGADAAGAGTGAKLKGWVATRNVTDRAARGVTEGMKNAQFGTGTTNEMEETYARKVQSGINQTQAENTRAQNLTNSEADLDPTKVPIADTVKLTAALDTLAKTLQSMTKEEKTKLGIKKLTNVHFAANLTEDDIDHFEKSGSYSAAEIQQIKDARKSGLTAIAAGGNTFAELDSAGKFTGTYSHPNAVSVGAGGVLTPIQRQQHIVSQGARTVGKMPPAVFMQPAMYQHLTPALLEERIKNGVTPADKADMRKALEAALDNALIAASEPAGTPLGSIPAHVVNANPWIKRWQAWQTSTSFHAADFFA